MCENFSRELMKVVVAQIAQAVGFHSIHQSACEAVADILQLCMLDNAGLWDYIRYEYLLTIHLYQHDTINLTLVLILVKHCAA
jgi:hypothetical protein